MNIEEEVVKIFLCNQGHPSIQYEPDGNIPPDFLVDNHIAIEVRRLNENYFNGSSIEGLEEKQINLFKVVKNVLDKYNNIETTIADSYGLVLEYARPIGNLKNIKCHLDQELYLFVHNQNRSTPHSIVISNSLKITLLKRPTVSNQLFCIYIEKDNNSGGLLEDLYVSNINYCISEKTSKIYKYHNKYKEWWLLLVDYLGWDLYSWESEKMRHNIRKTNLWNKVIVINPNAKKLLEVL